MRRALILVVLSCTAPGRPPPVAPAVPPPAVAPEPPPPPPHAEYGQLRELRNYYRVVSVGPYVHHFRAFFNHIELVEAVYEVATEPGARVHLLGTGFGGLIRDPGEQPAFDSAVAPLADAIRADIAAKYQIRIPRGITIVYDGLYRELAIEELTVRPSDPHDDYGGIRVLHVRLKADRELTVIAGRAPTEESGGRFRPGDLREGDVTSAPAWIDAVVGRQGEPQLWNLHADPSRFPLEVVSAFDAATLVAARRVLAGEPGPALAELAVEHDRARLPSDLDRRRWFSLYVNETRPGADRKQFGAMFTVIPERAIGGEERGEARLTIALDGGREIVVEGEIGLRAPALPEGASGAIELPFELAYRETAGEVAPFAGTMQLTAHAIVDGDRVYVESFDRWSVPQHVFSVGKHDEVLEAYLGFFGSPGDP